MDRTLEWINNVLMSDKEDPPNVPAPDTYLGSLYTYQERALGFAIYRPRTMLALDCGLGKTHIGIAYMLLNLPAMVVCPASLISSWVEHILSFAPSAQSQITVSSYNKMQPKPGLRCVVADEAHYLKTEGSKRSKMFGRIVRNCPRVLLMTGTPAHRNVDLFNLLKILDPEHFSAQTNFHDVLSRPPWRQKTMHMLHGKPVIHTKPDFYTKPEPEHFFRANDIFTTP